MARPRVKVPRTADKDEVITIKTLMSHRMETGLRKDKKTGELIPRKIINKFVAKFNGRDVFSVNIEPAVSTNPYLQFSTKVPESGDFEFTWFEDGGKEYKVKKSIKVG